MDRVTEITNRDFFVTDAVYEVLVHRQHTFIPSRIPLVNVVHLPAAHRVILVVLVNLDLCWNLHVAADSHTVQL